MKIIIGNYFLVEMNKQKLLFLTFLLCACFAGAQNWSLKITSYIGFRKYNLDTKAQKEETVLGGAFIKLYKGNTVVDAAEECFNSHAAGSWAPDAG